MRALILSILFGLAATLPAHSHEAKEAVAKAEAAVKKGVDKVQATGAAVAKDAKAMAKGVENAAAAAGEALGDGKAKGEAIIQTLPLDALKASAPSHLHNKIVHFPIALGFFGAIFLLLSYRWAAYLWPSRVLLGVAALTAAVALPTGEAMEEAIEGSSLMQVLEWHETFGKVSLGLLLTLLLLSFLPSTRKWSWVVVLAALFALGVAGGLGGVLAHS
jgi:uncharacterized membrane protein